MAPLSARSPLRCQRIARLLSHSTTSDAYHRGRRPCASRSERRPCGCHWRKLSRPCLRAWKPSSASGHARTHAPAQTARTNRRDDELPGLARRRRPSVGQCMGGSEMGTASCAPAA
eukprot:scaffold4850_cov340-Prasinococcus_capsulatus_cf.AAC.3